ncbi:MAG: ATP-binding cassette domain-containing protein [Gammaproteobacteria bacterium]|nr:ATP-binding cassette domain-containing protein [Gammaproteobacteria bacterium]MCP4090719.1 ATP-binding cassette domain-containing protein [Gammaproteobacteria bacterium]MCP4277146.1 ATP-binding cassette domain-containing protein [Gammaproteobacteria bacterium]MCP4832702.1 ATP-binding cassette domain-containing protein [Gammaproteobacteria bacterium]MCP4928044.1 ATP-binding cassette domain-containing protein [Gammaproteobacteria bacterium]
MSLIQFHEVALAFGEQVLLRDAEFSIHDGERVCLIGRNGAGKTSLLKLITGELEPDHGSIRFRSGIGISQLTQTLPNELGKTVREFVTAGLAEVEALAEEYRQRSATKLDAPGLRELEALQRQIEAHGGWNTEQQVDTVLSELDLPADKKLGELSGGWRRRVALGKALVSQPDVLLLDEPTNHLDLATIRWLEDRIYAWHGAVVFITHDRAFLQRLATRILEIDRTHLLSWDCDYRTYLKRKEQALQSEEEENARFDKKLAGEEAWVRQGIKARRTRNEGRVRALKSMREDHAKRIKRERGAHISIDEAEQSGRKVIRMKNVSYAYGEQNIIDGLSLQVMRGDRIGLVGNNGVGKSTLLRLMLGELEPQKGTVKLGTNLEVAYFDQLQRELDPNKSVAEIVGDGRDYITINGKERHIVGYLRGFLFSAKRAMTPVRVLSGGERNRVILARLFTRPSNLLVLDEPTNDLDVETLEVLEARLAEYAGTLIVVSHDREFLDNAITSILIFENDGKVHKYVGGYSDWLKHGHLLANTEAINKKSRAIEQAEQRAQQKQTPKKLSYKQQQDLEKIPVVIATLEKQIEELQQQTSEAKFYLQAYETTQPVLDKLAQTHAELDKLTNQWLELEELQQKFTATKQKKH